MIPNNKRFLKETNIPMLFCSMDTSARRPIKLRAAKWAKTTASLLHQWKIRPNTVSVWSFVFAVAGASCIFITNEFPQQATLLWISAAVLIQLRLLCNLLDGMLAIEGNLKTANGDLYNEMPDRLSDLVLLAAAGYVCTYPIAPTIGWLAASGALCSAYLRIHGANLTSKHDFCGPFAKPQRMALLTLLCLAQPFLKPWQHKDSFYLIVLSILALGTWLTVFRRFHRLSQTLLNK